LCRIPAPNANVILNIFRHSRTPEQIAVLSGDVHYFFVYDIKLRFRNGGPRIYQITSSLVPAVRIINSALQETTNTGLSVSD